jgi:hypothetical protein
MTAEVRQLRLRYPTRCASCGKTLEAGSTAWWDGTKKRALCLEHPRVADDLASPPAEMPADIGEAMPAPPPPIEAGTAGGSAQREFERRSTKREERIRIAHPHIGGLILALTDDPQSTRAWAIGAAGERALGSRFDEVAARGAIALHDRRIPGSRANIDHIVVARAGVFVVDAKKYAGKVEKRDVGGFFKKDERLYVGRRDCSKLLDGMHKQLAVVQGVLDNESALADIQLAGALCFVGAEWSLFARPIQIRSITVTWPKALVETFEKQAVLPPDRIATVGRVLAERLPPA